jgi:FkbM family methyltransferase
VADLINQIRPLFRRLRDRVQTAMPSRETGFGFSFIGSQIRFRHSSDELGTIEVLSRLAPGLTHFLNVGANAGFYCLLAESLGLQAFGFEPEPSAFRLFQRNLCNNRSACIAIPAAVAACSGRATFYGTGTAGSLLEGISGTPRWDRQTVTTLTLDGLFEAGGIADHSTDSLWLLDCEGAEPDALAGASRLLQATHPLLILELVPGRNHQSWFHCIKDLQRFGYTHLLACSSLLDQAQVRWRSLTPEALDDPAFYDNVLVVAQPYHQGLLHALPGAHLDQVSA